MNKDSSNIDTNEEVLNKLFKEVLDGLRDDITEAQMNVQQYQDLVAKDPDISLSMYGPTLNQALTVKGAARDRCLKFLNTFKDRVTKKEATELAKELKNQNTTNSGMDHNEMNRLIEEMKLNGELNNIKLDEDDDD